MISIKSVVTYHHRLEVSLLCSKFLNDQSVFSPLDASHNDAAV